MLCVFMKFLSHANAKRKKKKEKEKKTRKKKTERLNGFKFYTLIGRFQVIRCLLVEGVNHFRIGTFICRFTSE